MLFLTLLCNKSEDPSLLKDVYDTFDTSLPELQAAQMFSVLSRALPQLLLNMGRFWALGKSSKRHLSSF